MKTRRSRTRRGFDRFFNLEFLENRQLLSTYYVATTGSDSAAGTSAAPWKSLQKAADSVKAGDTVDIAAGDYAGFAKYGLKGTASAHITFKAEPGVNIVSKAPSETAVDCGIELSGYDASSGCAYVDLSGFNVNNTSGTIAGTASSGIRIRYSNNIGVYNCTASNNGWVGIYCAYVNNVTLDTVQSFNNNLFVDSSTQRNHGIYIANSSSNVTIRNAVVHDNNGNGIHMNGDGGVNSGFLLESNTIYNNGTLGGSAINCDGLQNSTIRNNLLYGNKNKGIALYNIDATGGSSNNSIYNNTVVMPSTSGNVAMQIKDDATGNTVENNIFIHEGTSQAMSIYSSALAGSTIDYNIYGGPTKMMSGDGSMVSFSDWRYYYPQFDAHSIVSTAGAVFVNAGSNDYHLSSTSPAINAGTLISGLLTDITGLLRSTTSVDIGAFAYNGTTPPPTTTAPSAPSSLIAAASSSSQVLLSWLDNSNNENGFKIERSINGATFTQIATVGAGVTTYSDNGLSGNTNYAYRVRATNFVGDSAYSNTSSTTTPVTLIAPASPTGLTATATGAASIALSWVDNTDLEDSFRLDRSSDGINFTPIATLAANTTSYNDTDLAANTTYTYRIRAYNIAGSSVWSNLASATTNDVAPAAPSNLAATANSSTQVILNWTDNSGNETGFKIERSSNGGAYAQIATTAANTTSFIDTTVAGGTNYAYRIRATNTAGDSAYSAAATVSTPAVPTAPVAPSNLAATVNSATQVGLTWSDNSNNETGFVIERSDAGGAFAQIATVAAGTTAYSDTALVANTNYTYRVMATNAVGNSDYSNTTAVTTPQAPSAPISPNQLAATASPGSIALTWADNSTNETNFRLDRSSDGLNYTQIATLPADATSYLDTAVTAGTTYTYRIRAYNDAGNSVWSNLASATAPQTPPAAPGGLTSTLGSPTQATLSWTDNSNNETSFSIERNDGTGYAVIGNVAANVTTWTDTTLVENVNYTYRVQALGTAGPSTYSGETSLVSPMAAPGSLSVTATGVDHVDLAWIDNAATESGFQIERSLDGQTFTVIGTAGANATGYSDSAVSSGTTYDYRVLALNSYGQSPYSNIISATTDHAVPVAPSNLSATAQDSSSVVLSWTGSNAEAMGYTIERQTDSGQFEQVAYLPADATTWTDSSLAPATSYTYRMTATGVAGTSAYSNLSTTTTLLAKPQAPDALHATAIGSNQVFLDWTVVLDNTDRNILQRSTDGVNWTTVGIFVPSTNTYTDQSLSPITTYQYRVCTGNDQTTSDWTGPVSVTTLPPAVPPAAPTDLVATGATPTQIELSWQLSGSNIDSTILQRTTDGVNWTNIASLDASATSYADDGLAPNTSYTYRIEALNVNGDSGWSTVATASTLADTTAPTAALTPLTLTAQNQQAVNFTVTYTDDVAINNGTIDGQDIIVTGPHNYRQTATLVSLVQGDTPGTWVATYSVTAPHWTWSSHDDGAYKVSLQSDQVLDTSGNAADATTLGYFNIAI